MASADVSVIIPCYKCADTVRAAVHSVAQQSLPPREVILVDDGSPDSTSEELRRLQKEYGAKFVRALVLARNSGPSVARNAAWDAARSGYVAFLDADDEWHPRKIELQFGWMSGNPDVAISAHRVGVTQEGSANKGLDTALFQRVLSRRRVLSHNIFPTSSVMLRRSLPHRFRPGKHRSEDYLLWLQVILQGNGAAVAPVELAFRRNRGFGVAGLSADLKAMEWGALESYWLAFREGLLSPSELGVYGAYSVLRYVRREILVWLGG